MNTPSLSKVQQAMGQLPLPDDSEFRNMLIEVGFAYANGRLVEKKQIDMVLIQMGQVAPRLEGEFAEGYRAALATMELIT